MLPDVLAPDLDLVVCGTGAGARSAAAQQYYANPTNQFWAVLERVGLTPRRLHPAEFRELLRYGIGLTDLVKDRAGVDAITLGGDVNLEGLRQKMERLRPRVVAFNGLGAARAVLGRDVGYGRYPFSRTFGIAELWIVPSTSGAARGSWDDSVWRRLGEAVAAIRIARA